MILDVVRRSCFGGLSFFWSPSLRVKVGTSGGSVVGESTIAFFDRSFLHDRASRKLCKYLNLYAVNENVTTSIPRAKKTIAKFQRIG